MFKKISLTMAIVYGLSFILTIIALDAVILLAYKNNQIAKNESKVVWFANIMANIAKNNFDNTMNLNNEIRKNSINTQNRVLILDLNEKVLADSMSAYYGKHVSNQQTKNSLIKGSESFGYYLSDGKRVMMCSVPIIIGKKIVGAALISTYIEDIYKDVDDLRNQVILISSIAVFFIIILSLFIGRKISRPIVELTQASAEILAGRLDTKVDIKRQDEIGLLAETFNEMSAEIFKIDTNRRRFISDVSHELKTPLTSIKVLIESLIESNSNVDLYKEYLVDINNEIDRLTILVKSLLTVTKFEEFEIKKESINLYDEVDLVIRLLNPLLSEKKMKLSNNCSSELTIEADKNMFREILINLIDNSIKYGKEKGYIEVSCKKGKLVELSIKDNGCGILQSELPHIFDMFYRVDKSRNRNTGGSGIGLYIVYNIIKLHKWDIRVTSEKGQGTEFIIMIR